MIFEALMDAGLWILDAFMDVLDVLPAMPDSVISALSQFLSLLFDNACLVSFFFPVSFAVPILIIVFTLSNWKRIYHFLMWIWRKIPISSE